MNRAQRRAVGAPKEPTYTLTRSQIQDMKQQCTNQAADLAFKLMLCIPAIVIHEKFGKLMKKDSRVETFVDFVLEVYDNYNKGMITIEELEARLKEETGISFEDVIDKKFC